MWDCFYLYFLPPRACRHVHTHTHTRAHQGMRWWCAHACVVVAVYGCCVGCRLASGHFVCVFILKRGVHLGLHRGYVLLPRPPPLVHNSLQNGQWRHHESVWWWVTDCSPLLVFFDMVFRKSGIRMNECGQDIVVFNVSRMGISRLRRFLGNGDSLVLV